jgi:hypothetical protein
MPKGLYVIRNDARGLATGCTQVLKTFRTYANNSQNPDFLVGEIHELPLPHVVLHESKPYQIRF